MTPPLSWMLRQTYIVYELLNRDTGLSYIGLTRYSGRRRSADHFRGASRGRLIGLAIEQYGRDAFEVKELARIQGRSDAYCLEKILILDRKTYAPHGYNGSRPALIEERFRQIVASATVWLS